MIVEEIPEAMFSLRPSPTLLESAILQMQQMFYLLVRADTVSGV
jgi:hypothetical protein